MIARLENLIDDYAPTIKRQLECSDLADCGCTFCDFVADLRSALADEASYEAGREDCRQ